MSGVKFLLYRRQDATWPDAGGLHISGASGEGRLGEGSVVSLPACNGRDKLKMDMLMIGDFPGSCHSWMLPREASPFPRELPTPVSWETLPPLMHAPAPQYAQQNRLLQNLQ